jgi:WD40 repeat protein
MVVTAYADGMLILWDVETGQEVRRFIGHTNGVEGVVFSHDGQKILSSGYDLTAILWDVSTGSIIRRFTNHTGAVFQVRFSPDDRFVLSGSGDGTTLWWNVETGDVIRRYSNAGVYQPAFGPDGRTVFVGFRGESPELWRIDDMLDELLEWTQENRYIPELTCEQRELYRVLPLCDDDNQSQ